MIFTSNMKRVICLLATILVLLSGCIEDHKLGWMPPIELSTKELIFGPDGGEEDVYCFNYQPHVDHIWDKVLDKHYYPDKESEVYLNCSAPGISVSIKDDKITVTVEPSNERRVWGVGIACLDTFSGISVYQNATPQE